MEFSEREKQRNTASKYDFVKVKVWLGEGHAGAKHYYILSRYLICRMLTVTKIPQMKAVKIAMELKKKLVDDQLLNVDQERLEATLFAIMEGRGFGADYMERYKMVSNFFQQRRPLIVLICGIPCSGKSTIAQALASRFNLPNVLQTDVIHELLCDSEEGMGDPIPLWERAGLQADQVVAEFQREARMVRKAVTGDLIKTIRDGKSVIIEGMHIDPGLYLYEFGRYGLHHLQGGSPRRGPGAAVRMLQPLTTRLADTALSPTDLEALSPTDDRGDEGAAQQRIMRKSLSEKDAVPPPRFGREHASLSAVEQRLFRKTASFALSSSATSFRPRISIASLPGQRSESIPIGSSPETTSDADPTQPPASRSPGMQWLHHLGVATHRLANPTPGLPAREADLSSLPSASAWLGRKSRQLMGLSPSPVPPAGDTAVEGGSAAVAGEGMEASHKPSLTPAAESRLRAHEEARPEEKSDAGAGGNITGLDSHHGPRAGLRGKDESANEGEVQMDNSGGRDGMGDDAADSLPALRTVFQDPSPDGGGEGTAWRLPSLPGSPGHHSSCHSSFSRKRSDKPHTSASASDHDGSSNEGRDASRRAYLRPRGEIQDHGSVSLALSETAYSENGHSSDTDLGNERPAMELTSLKLREAQLHPRPPVPPGILHHSHPSAGRGGHQHRHGVHFGDPEAQEGASRQGWGGSSERADDGPVFVPIVMKMDEADHDLLLRQHYSPKQGGGWQQEVGEVQRRLHLLQEYLSTYSSSNVPVVCTSLVDMGATMDMLHDYLLECIALQMQAAPA